jgi:hypothetical protein
VLRLTGVVQGALGHPFELAFTYFDGELARAARGKFEELISHVVGLTVPELARGALRVLDQKVSKGV